MFQLGIELGLRHEGMKVGIRLAIRRLGNTNSHSGPLRESV